MKLRGDFDLCKHLFLDAGREQMEINKELIGKMLVCYKGPEDPIDEQGC